MPCAPVKLVLFMPWDAPRAAAPEAALPACGALLAGFPASVVGLVCGVAGGAIAGGSAAAVAAVAAVAAGMAGMVGILGLGIRGTSLAVLKPIISPYILWFMRASTHNVWLSRQKSPARMGASGAGREEN